MLNMSRLSFQIRLVQSRLPVQYIEHLSKSPDGWSPIDFDPLPKIPDFSSDAIRAADQVTNRRGLLPRTTDPHSVKRRPTANARQTANMTAILSD